MKYDVDLLKATSVVLRRLRSDAGLSQEELAAQAGITRSMVDKIERRERLPSIDTLMKIAPVFKQSASDIIKEIEKSMIKG